MQIAERVYSVAQEQNDAMLMIGAYAAERFEQPYFCAELHRLRGVYSRRLRVQTRPKSRLHFCAAISTAKEQKSLSLEKRAEGTYAEYRRQKASALGGHTVPTTSLARKSLDRLGS